MACSEIDILRELAIHGESRASEIKARISIRLSQEVNLGRISALLACLAEAGEITSRPSDADIAPHRQPHLYQITDLGRGHLVRHATSPVTEGVETPVGFNPALHR